jgi:hypothetical protein
MTSLKYKTVPTSLDFHPNLPGNEVLVIIGRWELEEYYVSIRGDDDIMLQTNALTFEKAAELYNSIQNVTMKEAMYFKGSSENNGFPS